MSDCKTESETKQRYTGWYSSRQSEEREHHNRQKLITCHMRKRAGRACKVTTDKNGYYHIVNWYDNGY